MLLQQASSSPGPSGTASPKLPPSPRPNPSPSFSSRLTGSPSLSDGASSSPRQGNSPMLGANNTLGANSPKLGASPKFGSSRLGSWSPRTGRTAVEDEAALERLQTELKEGWTVHTGRDGRLYYCKWGILFSHPYDFTPICTTELARVLNLLPEFKRLGVKVIGLSCDPVESHEEWLKDIIHYADASATEEAFPIIDDTHRKLSKELGMLDADEVDDNNLPLPVRAVFILDPNKKLRLTLSYPVTVGRNFDEIIRTIESLQLFDKHCLGTPADWKQGDECIIHPLIPQEKAKELYGEEIKIIELPSGKPYLRMVPQPKDKKQI